MPIRNQADAAKFFEARRKEVAKLAVDEQGVVDIINWGNLPTTKKVREAFSVFEQKVLKRFKKGAIGEKQWTEAEGRALGLALEFTGLFDEILDQAQKQLVLIQQKEQKEQEQ